MIVLLVLPMLLFGQLSEEVSSFVSVKPGKIAIIHATLIDGTGRAAQKNQTIVLNGDRIAEVGAESEVSIPDGATVIDASGKTVIPGLVMLHEHMFYTKIFEGKFDVGQMSGTFPRLYLAGGVTSLRTAGGIEPQTDLNIKKQVDSGQMAGSKMDITGPHLNSEDIGILSLGTLKHDEQASQAVNYWADMGCTSMKVYVTITTEALKNVIHAAHQRGIKVTGHLCSITYREAADLGIDNLEHGFYASSDFIPDKVKDQCDPFDMRQSLVSLDQNSSAMISLQDHLIDKGVALTSTLPVFEPYTGREVVPGGGLDALVGPIKERVMKTYVSRINKDQESAALFKKMMAWEKMFYDKGGLLVTGTDPTGAGHVIPGYANQHIIELFVEAGFTLEDAVKVSTLNGAIFLEKADDIGTVQSGKLADLILIDGNLEADVMQIRKMEIVFKDGVGYDSARLFESVQGLAGLH